MIHYAVIVARAEHRDALNRVLNVLWGDEGDNLGVALTNDSGLTISHWLCGLSVTASQAQQLQTLADNIPTPLGGWPWQGVTAQQAHDAAASMYLNINSGNTDLGELAGQNQATVLAALNILIFDWV